MKTFDRRLNKLELELGVRKESWRLLVLVSDAARALALNHDACVQILDEAGFLASSGCVIVDLGDVPDGLSADETKRYLRENGSQLCSPRLPKKQ